MVDVTGGGPCMLLSAKCLKNCVPFVFLTLAVPGEVQLYLSREYGVMNSSKAAQCVFMSLQNQINSYLRYTAQLLLITACLLQN